MLIFARQLYKESWDRTATKEHSGQDGLERTVGQDSRDRTAGEDSMGSNSGRKAIAMTERPEHDRTGQLQQDN
jgi:hypothetical protein